MGVKEVSQTPSVEEKRRNVGGLRLRPWVGTCIFGLVWLTLLVLVIVYDPHRSPEYRQLLLAIASALSSGTFGFFLVGDIGLKMKPTQTPSAEFVLRVSGGIFAMVLWWWLSPLSPISVPEKANLSRLHTSAGVEQTVEPIVTLLPSKTFFSAVNSIALTSDGETAATAEEDGSIHVWRVRSGQEPRQIRETAKLRAMRAVALSPNGEAIVAGGSDGKVRFWQTSGGTVPKMIASHTGYVYEVYLGVDGQRLASTGIDTDEVKSVRLWSVSEDLRVVETFRTPRLAVILDVSPDLGLVALYSNTDRRVELWSINDGRMVRPMDNSAQSVVGTFSSDGEWFAAASDRGEVRVWQVKDGTQRINLAGVAEEVVSIAVHHGGELAAVGCRDGSIYLWDVSHDTTKNNPKVIKEHQEEVFSLTFSANGRILASGGKDRKIRIWEISNRR